ncbi:carbohydrate kinase family protein [Aquibacillus halophilus]|uniref:Carbohydrate kinase family protein n=1 Tax=Aquibacillus halophilus TaxID=930132 RepID=A0A6A8DCF2_9BACI|nr:carbohydrate kinase family protein [Aquibacillus halophilus]MRH41461.1 carbohydrate kinase family protein [Aquibacillus halophilus]
MRKGIAIAGTISLDEIKAVDCYPDKSELTTINSVRRSIGGAVSNCSVALAKIDRNLVVEAITYLGNDEKGKYLYECLNTYPNIDLKQLKIIGETPFTDVIQDKHDKTRTFLTFRGNSSLFNENSIDLIKLKSKILHIAYILLLDSLDEEDLEYGTKMAKLLKKAQELGIKTSIDIVSESGIRYEKTVPPSLKYTNYCVINEYEAGKSVGINLRDRSGKLLTGDIKKVLYKLKELGVKDWVVVHVPEGSFGYDGKNVYSIPSLFIEIESIKGTVGAGDAYVAGILYGAHKGFNLNESMKLATASAASSLFEEDSTSGIKNYEELVLLYDNYPKREDIKI